MEQQKLMKSGVQILGWVIILPTKSSARKGVKQSYGQIQGKYAWNTEKTRGNVMLGVPGVTWQNHRVRKEAGVQRKQFVSHCHC